MKTHKLELILATIMLIIHLIMVAIHKQIETNFTYWIILELLLLVSVILFCRVAWERFKKNVLNESGVPKMKNPPPPPPVLHGYQPTDKLDTSNPPDRQIE